MNGSLRERAREARAEIERGRLRGPRLRELLTSIPPMERDAWTDELLGLGEPPADVPDLPRGSVPYLPSAVDEILATVIEAPVEPDDELVDLGSGLGRVVMLAHLLTGARARGVEIQEPLVRHARQRCSELALEPVSFVHADAAEADLEGSVFYLYAPFSGDTLSRVLARLELLARRRSIVLCAVGIELGERPWLRARKSSCPSLTLYDSIPTTE